MSKERSGEPGVRFGALEQKLYGLACDAKKEDRFFTAREAAPLIYGIDHKKVKKGFYSLVFRINQQLAPDWIIYNGRNSKGYSLEPFREETNLSKPQQEKPEKGIPPQKASDRLVSEKDRATYVQIREEFLSNFIQHTLGNAEQTDKVISDLVFTMGRIGIASLEATARFNSGIVPFDGSNPAISTLHPLSIIRTNVPDGTVPSYKKRGQNPGWGIFAKVLLLYSVEDVWTKIAKNGARLSERGKSIKASIDYLTERDENTLEELLKIIWKCVPSQDEVKKDEEKFTRHREPAVGRLI